MAEDARGVIVRLTENGRGTLQRAAPGYVAWVKAHFITSLREKNSTRSPSYPNG